MDFIEPAHDKPYNKACVTSKDSDQLVHPPIMSKFLVYPSLTTQEAVEGRCDQLVAQVLMLSYCELFYIQNRAINVCLLLAKRFT